MKKMYLAIFLIILVVFVFAGCLSFSNSFETATTTEYYEDATDDVNAPEVTYPSGESVTGATDNVTGNGTETTTSGNSAEEKTTSSQSSTPVDAPAQSEYDYLKSGVFHMKGKMIDKTGTAAPMEIAITPDSIYMLSDFDGTPMGMLIADETVYMVYPEKKAYLEFSDSLMSMAGLDINELANPDTMDFGNYGSLSDADSMTEEDYNGRKCSVYHFTVENGQSHVYLDGTKLVRLETMDKNGKLVTAMEIESITGTVPADKSNPPSSYKAYKGMTGMFGFMKLLEDVVA